MDASCTRKAPSTCWRSTHFGLSSPPRISIQWAVIVKYSFMHLECDRLHVKAGFPSFQLLPLFNLLIPSAYKFDIYKIIQCTSQETCNKSLHYHKTNQISTAINIVAKRKIKQCNGRKKPELHRKKLGSNTCKANSPPLR